MGSARFWIVPVLSICFLGGCITNPATGRVQLDLINDEEVAAMGEEAKPGMIAEFGGEVASPELRDYVARVGFDLARNVEPEFDGIDWEFFVLDSEILNAFALPGGKVFVTRGLLSHFDNEAEVAGVLGHEIGHVTGKHIDERLSQAMLSKYGLEFLGMTTEQELVRIGAQLLSQGAILKWGRDQESESDIQGLKYMTMAGYDPRGMVQVLEVLRDAASGHKQWEILSTHPHPESRLKDVEKVLRKQYEWALDNTNLGLHRDRFQQDAAPYLD